MGLGVTILLMLMEPILVSFVPLPPALFTPPPPAVELLDRNGEPLRLTRDGDRPFQQFASLSEIPQALVSATLAAEDSRFWRHHGVDWRADLRAAWQLIWNRRIISGASTITQQIDQVSAPRPRTFKAKIIETAQALRLEQVWDKQRILDRVSEPGGLRQLQPRLCGGGPILFRQTAARFQHGRVRVAGRIAAVPGAIESARPFRRRPPPPGMDSHAHERSRVGWPAMNSSARCTSRCGWLRADASLKRRILWICCWNRERWRREIPASAPRLDLRLNRFAGQTLRRQLDALQAEHAGEGAIVVIENQTGNVLALVGSRDYFSAQSGQVDGAYAPRSTGSALKPFLYWLAFEKGATPASIVADVPTDFATSTGLFSPVNYDRHCYGPVRYRVALANSLNISGGEGPGFVGRSNAAARFAAALPALHADPHGRLLRTRPGHRQRGSAPAGTGQRLRLPRPPGRLPALPPRAVRLAAKTPASASATRTRPG